MLEYKNNDGGRSQYFKPSANDCVTRAIAIATGKDYKEVYDELFSFLGYTPRNGIRHKDVKRAVEHFGFHWTALMSIGDGCKAHLKEGEIPMQGTIIVRLSGHLACVKDGVLHDTHDSSRGGTRCVYGYWSMDKPKEEKPKSYTYHKFVVEIFDIGREYDYKTLAAARAAAVRLCNHYCCDRYRITEIIGNAHFRKKYIRVDV